MAGNVEGAREVLTEAFAANPDSEQVWLAAAKLEWETGEPERARVLLQRARERAPSARVYMKSALLERENKHYNDALNLIEEGILKYSNFPKLYMMGGQICSEDLAGDKQNLELARKFYQRGLQSCPNDSVTLWILASRLEEQAGEFDSSLRGGVTKARSLLELSRLKNPKNPELWVEAIRLERRAGNDKLAVTLHVGSETFAVRLVSQAIASRKLRQLHPLSISFSVIFRFPFSFSLRVPKIMTP